MKKYCEFNEEEKDAIRKMNEKYFIADMSDDYRRTEEEKATLLKQFNEKFGYHFFGFCKNYYDEEETCFV